MIAAIVQGPLGRLVPVAFLLLSLQTTMFAELRPAGVALQMMLAFSAAAGVAGGPERGMIAGFVCGVLFDLGTGGPLGASSITMGLAGVVAGSVAFLNIEIRWWIGAAFVAIGSAVGELAVPVVRLFIGQTEVFSPQLWTIIPVVAIASAIVSPLFIPVTRWALRAEPPAWKVPPA